MKPNGGGGGDGEPGGSKADATKTSFGSFSEFKEKFSFTVELIQGSGWGWLVYNLSAKKAEYKLVPNQTSPRTEGLIPPFWDVTYGNIPITSNTKNRRPDYISAWWNVVNWDDATSRF
jgi:Fe-Mn family superoxide dismutase